MPVLRITAGSYERLLFGYAVDTTSQLSTQLFGFGAHIGCIKSMAISAKGGGVLCTGGQDELIKVYSLKSMRALGELFAHNATVSQIEAFGKTHVLSGDEQGKLIMWRTKDWEPLTALKGHKAAITGIAIHPSGKLALTVSSDRQLICWNLLRGLKATKSRLPDTPFAIHFSPTGVHYAILFNHSLVIYDTASTSSIAVHASPRTRINAFAFVDDHRFVVGGEDGLVIMLEMSEEDEDEDEDEEEEGDQEPEERAIRAIAHFTRDDASTRIRSVVVHAFTPDADEDAAASDNDDVAEAEADVDVKPHAANVEYYLAAASSAGIVSVWRIPSVSPRIGEAVAKVDPITELDTKCRLTCLAMDAIDGELVPEDQESEEEAPAEQGVQSAAEEEPAAAAPAVPKPAASKKRKSNETVAEAPVDGAADGKSQGSEAGQAKRKRAKKNKNKK